MGTSDEDQYTFRVRGHKIFLKMRTASDKVIEEIKSRFYVKLFFFPENCAVYEIM